ncbi:hypothetical protein ABC733_26660 [Mangrovibacter sp. SLW1]
MMVLLWIVGGLVAWCLFGYVWCHLFVDDDEDDEHQECPYE